VQAPAKDQPQLRLPVSSQLTVLSHFMDELRVLRINHFQSRDAPAPDKFPCAAAQHGDVVAVLDVVAPHNAVRSERVGQLLPGVHPHSPVSQRLVALPGVSNVEIFVWTLLRHGTLRLNDYGLWKALIDTLQRILAEPGWQSQVAIFRPRAAFTSDCSHDLWFGFTDGTTRQSMRG